MHVPEVYPTRISLIIELPKNIFQYHFFHLMKGNPTEYIDLWDGIVRAVNGADRDEIAIFLHSIISLVNDDVVDACDPELNDFADAVHAELENMIHAICSSTPPTDCIVYTDCNLYDDRTIILNGNWDRERGNNDGDAW